MGHAREVLVNPGVLARWRADRVSALEQSCSDANPPRKARPCSPQLLLVIFAAAVAFVAPVVASGEPSNTSAGKKIRSFHGAPLIGSTGLRPLVAAAPPFIFDVDKNRPIAISGLNLRALHPTISVLEVGNDAIIWSDERNPMSKAPPRAELYLLKAGSTRASLIGVGWEVAPASGGDAIWVKSYLRSNTCVLGEISVRGRNLRRPVAISCSSHLLDAGGSAVIASGSMILDPEGGRVLARRSGIVARAGDYLLTQDGATGPLTLSNLRTRRRWELRYPSPVAGQGGIDQAQVAPNHRMIALSLSNPAYEGSGTQVDDLWVLDLTSRRFTHLPDMPAIVLLKATSIAWTPTNTLAILAEAGNASFIGLWRPEDASIRVRRVRLPARQSGSDSFVAWLGP